MKSKLLLVYLKIQPLLLTVAVIGLFLILMNHWENTRITSTTSWIVKDVVSGDSFIASRKQKQFQVKLCGISASSDESREYLRSLLNKGDGSVVVNPVQTEWGVTIAEVFVQLKPDYETENHLNTEMVMAGVATIADYKSCPSAEYLEMAEGIVNQTPESFRKESKPTFKGNGENIHPQYLMVLREIEDDTAVVILNRVRKLALISFSSY